MISCLVKIIITNDSSSFITLKLQPVVTGSSKITKNPLDYRPIFRPSIGVALCNNTYDLSNIFDLDVRAKCIKEHATNL